MTCLDPLERKEIINISEAIERALPEYELRGVFRIVENNPQVGSKVDYQEKRIGELPLEFIYGGIILVCKSNDKTNGLYNLEVSTRDKTIRMHKSAPSVDAMVLRSELEKEKNNYNIII